MTNVVRIIEKAESQRGILQKLRSGPWQPEFTSFGRRISSTAVAGLALSEQRQINNHRL
ncbi:hypothetical protein [Chachezhania antarctica]|uniref:hypothetical protein n=1 Tax=Chachezhania antarctica TaxID=2340860 RepID=UPI0013CECA05|nr:hypothetical protein [Chachezhania antarctica]